MEQPSRISNCNTAPTLEDFRARLLRWSCSRPHQHWSSLYCTRCKYVYMYRVFPVFGFLLSKASCSPELVLIIRSTVESNSVLEDQIQIQIISELIELVIDKSVVPLFCQIRWDSYSLGIWDSTTGNCDISPVPTNEMHCLHMISHVYLNYWKIHKERTSGRIRL